MVRQFPRNRMICKQAQWKLRVILTHMVAISCIPALWAASSQSTNSNIPDANSGTRTVARSSAEELFVLTAFSGSCYPIPPFSSQATCVTKYTASGQLAFSTMINAADLFAITLDGSGNLLVAGTGYTGFVTTPGAYEPTSAESSAPVLCKLSGSDGHPLFCTFVDVTLQINPSIPPAGLAVDSAGNAYISGFSSAVVKVEQISATGATSAYLAGNSVPLTGVIIAADTNSDLYCLYSDNNGISHLDEWNATGIVTASVANLGSEYPIALVLDPSGNPEALLNDNANPANYRLVKYSAGLSTLLFDTEFVGGGGVLGVAIDAAGVLDVVGGTKAANLTQVKPVGTCIQTGPPSGFALQFNEFLVRIDANGNLLQSTYLENLIGNFGSSMEVGTLGTSTAVWWGASGLAPLTLGPASAAVQLACIGSATSFLNTGMAPNEIVSLFWSGSWTGYPDHGGPGCGRNVSFRGWRSANHLRRDTGAATVRKQRPGEPGDSGNAERKIYDPDLRGGE